MVRNNSLMHYANYLFILSVCIDQGDGRWKEREKDIPVHDIEAYKELAEQLGDQMEVFYEDYPIDELRNFHIHNIMNKHVEDRDEPVTERDVYKQKLSELLYFPDTTVRPRHSDGKTKSFKLSEHIAKVYKTKGEPKQEEAAVGWPKFDEILRAIGRKYDWKNDRWIKIKEKIDKRIQGESIALHRSEHENHNFKYKIVKLNRSKNRRNVVVAVTAVR